MIYTGIDSGSRTIKVALLEATSQSILDMDIADQSVGQEHIAMALYRRVLERNRLAEKDITRVVATGYGRNNIGLANLTITEITCHAVGARFVDPSTRTVIDIGGQDSKYIRLDEHGAVEDFGMNDRCAAGTGCFLEMIARRFNLTLSQLGQLAAHSTAAAGISSMCAVFAETEIIGLLAGGAAIADIVAGVQQSIASRIASMMGHGALPPVVLTGGVALVPGMTEALSRALGHAVRPLPDPQMIGAIGAAVLARQTKTQ